MLFLTQHIFCANSLKSERLLFLNIYIAVLQQAKKIIPGSCPI